MDIDLKIKIITIVKTFITMLVLIYITSWMLDEYKQSAVKEGQKIAEKAQKASKSLIIDIQTGMNTFCYHAANHEKGNEQKLRAELIRTLYEYKGKHCINYESCGYEIIWVKGCLAKVRFIQSTEEFYYIEMVYTADLNTGDIAWESIKENNTDE